MSVTSYIVVKQPNDGEEALITEGYRNLTFYVLYLLNVSVNHGQCQRREASFFSFT